MKIPIVDGQIAGAPPYHLPPRLAAFRNSEAQAKRCKRATCDGISWDLTINYRDLTMGFSGIYITINYRDLVGFDHQQKGLNTINNRDLRRDLVGFHGSGPTNMGIGGKSHGFYRFPPEPKPRTAWVFNKSMFGLRKMWIVTANNGDWSNENVDSINVPGQWTEKTLEIERLAKTLYITFI